MSQTITDQLEDLLLEEITSYLQVYINPDVFVNLEATKDHFNCYHLTLSDENHSIIYETEMEYGDRDSTQGDALKDVGLAMQKDERYIQRTLFQEIADALSMYRGMLGGNNLITIINNHLPYFDEKPNESASANQEMNYLLSCAMGIHHSPVYLCCYDNTCSITDSLYMWLTNLYDKQKLDSDINGIWSQPGENFLCPICIHPQYSEKAGEIIPLTEEEFKSLNPDDPDSMELLLNKKHDEYLNSMTDLFSDFNGNTNDAETDEIIDMFNSFKN